jgi:hypothetical protein
MKNDFLDDQNRAGRNGGDGGDARSYGTWRMDSGHGLTGTAIEIGKMVDPRFLQSISGNSSV